MADLGSISLLIALVLAIYASLGSLLGATKRIPSLIESARHATYLTPAVLGVATLSLVVSFVTRDFQVRYVSLHSNLAMDPKLIWVAFYAGNEGSLLYISLALSVLGSIAIAKAPKASASGLPYTTALIMLVLTFFLGVMTFLADPFIKLAVIPADGQGINPLLTHTGMFFHPPIMMTGLVGVTIPFAFAMGALTTGKIDDWVEPGRLWGLIIWAILGTGLLIGSWWSYTILGWGGYWGWDPIENVGFMPFLALTAFIHSMVVQRERGLFKKWNMILINIAFGLSLLGMFFNRGGPVPSVHSFAQSTLGWAFLAFMAIGVIGSFSVLILRSHLLQSVKGLESSVSRESAFLINNLLLLGIVFVTLWGVVFPLVSLLAQGREATVAAPYFNQINGPLFLILIFVMGIGPLVPWRKTSWNNFRRAFAMPFVFFLITVLALFLLGIRQPFSLLGFGFSALVVGGILQEWAKGDLIRHRRGENYLVAFGKLIASNRPRYGGYIVHLAIILLAIGVTGSSFYSLQKDVFLAPGQSASIGDYTVKFVNLSTLDKADRTEFVANIEAFQGSKPLGIFSPWRAFYPSFNVAPTRAAIHSTAVEDLYIILGDTLDNGTATFRILVNPMVMWLWVAGPILILGTLIALLPSRRRGRPLPSEAEETSRVASSEEDLIKTRRHD